MDSIASVFEVTPANVTTPFNDSLALQPSLNDVVSYLRWSSLCVGSVGIPANIFTYLAASRFNPVTSGTTFMKSLAFVELLMVSSFGVIQPAAILTWRSLLSLNNYICKFGRFFGIASSTLGTYIEQKHLKLLTGPSLLTFIGTGTGTNRTLSANLAS